MGLVNVGDGVGVNGGGKTMKCFAIPTYVRIVG